MSPQEVMCGEEGSEESALRYYVGRYNCNASVPPLILIDLRPVNNPLVDQRGDWAEGFISEAATIAQGDQDYFFLVYGKFFPELVKSRVTSRDAIQELFEKRRKEILRKLTHHISVGETYSILDGNHRANAAVLAGRPLDGQIIQTEKDYQAASLLRNNKGLPLFRPEPSMVALMQGNIDRLAIAGKELLRLDYRVQRLFPKGRL